VGRRVSGEMSREQIPVDHPDDDMLADLAADVLPVDQARMVEAHVLSCRTCTDLLADAESTRRVLLAQRPVGIPPEIVARLDQALAVETATGSVPGAPQGENQSYGGEPPWIADAYPGRNSGWTGDESGRIEPLASPIPIGGLVLPDHRTRDSSLPEENPYGAQPTYETGAQPTYETGAQPTYETDPFPRPASPAPGASVPHAPEREVVAVPARRAGWADDTWAGVPMDGQTSTFAMPAVRDGMPHRSSLSGRGGRGSSRTRKQAREEDRDDQQFGRRNTVLAIAAGGLVIAALGLFVLRPLLGDGDSSPTAANISTNAPVTGSIAAPVLTTGTVYTESGFAEQARKLVVTASNMKGKALDNESAADTDKTTGQAQPTDAADSSPSQGDTSLKDPVKLHSCLDALSTDPASLVAVDLARFGEQDAAVVVIQSSSGGYEVWAVARNCSSDADGTLKFQVVPEAAG
jgi:hypothetical protein